jgi:hypothetical protein
MRQVNSDSGIERSIGLLLIGLAIGAFMILTVAGMNSVRKNAEQVKPQADLLPAEPQPQLDFASGT